MKANVRRRVSARKSIAGIGATVLAVSVLGGFTFAATSPASASTGSGGSVQTIYSSYNNSSTTYQLSAQPSKTLAPISDAQSSLPTITLDPSVTYQTWQGFGDSLDNTTVYNLEQLTSANRTAALNALFNPSTGDDFNLMRTTIGCADFCSAAPNYWTYDDNGGVADPSLSNFSISQDITDGTIAVLQQIEQINPSVQFFGSLWSPPAWMKTTNSIIGPEAGSCPTDGTEPRVDHGSDTGSSVDYYPVLANYYVKYIQAYAAQGIPIYAVTLQNEPSISMNYPSTCFTPTEQAAFAVDLKSAFTSAGLSTKIWGLDDNEQNTFPVSDSLLANSSVASDVDGLGYHNYAGTQLWEPTSEHYEYPTKTQNLTEITNGADTLVGYFRNWIASYDAWATMYQFMPGPGPGYWSNASSTDPDFYTPSLLSFASGGTSNYQLTAWYYTFGQFSRYIQPGAVRIDSTGTLGGNLTNVSFKNPDGTIVTVVVNRIPDSTNSASESTPAVNFRIATPDGQFTDTIPGDTVATYIYTPTTGDVVSTAGATATASASNTGYPALQGNDENTSTEWTSGANETNGQTYTLDLGSAKTFDQLTLDEGSLPADSPSGYQVETSSDGSTWSSAIATGSGTANLTNITFSPVTARYLRIAETASASHWWSIAEISLYNSASGLLPITSASASAFSSSGTDVPANAIDGTLGTRWSSGVAQAPGQTFTMNLGSTRSIDGLDMSVGASSGDYPRGYSIATSTDGTTWSSPVASGGGSSPDTVVAFPATTAHYLRITQTGTASANYWSIAELKIYDRTPTVLSRSGWTATASVASSSATNALDGSQSTRWTTGTAQAAGQWFQLDAGSIIQTNGIDLTAGTTGDQPQSYNAQTSLDGTNWTTVASGSGLTAESQIAWDTTYARYVRITLTGAAASNYWSITEANLWGVATTPAFGTPLSQSGWTATASATASGSNPANAIDGLLNTRWSDGAAQTGGEWFQIDLGSTKSFSKIQLNASGPIDNNNGDYPRGYAVYVSNGSGWTEVDAGVQNSPVVNITLGSQSARYINVHQTGTARDHYWSIGEFNVLN